VGSPPLLFQVLGEIDGVKVSVEKLVEESGEWLRPSAPGESP
jgi:hypothetical protein